MTIALGVICTDGVVLGTDLQHTRGIEKFPGRKLWDLCPEKELPILMVGAGSTDSMKRVIRVAEGELRKKQLGNAPTTDQIIESIEEGLCSLYFKHIDPAPEKEHHNLHVFMMLAVRDAGGARLFTSNRTHLTEVTHSDRYRCEGSGVYVGYHDLALLLPDYPTVEVAAQVVSYVLAIAKADADGVGEGSNVHMLYDDGRWDSLLAPERTKIETALIGMLGELPDLLACCDPHLRTEERVDFCLARIKKQILKCRDLTVERSQDRIRRREYSTSLQSTTTDPPPPPSSQESPEESNES